MASSLLFFLVVDHHPRLRFSPMWNAFPCPRLADQKNPSSVPE